MDSLLQLYLATPHISLSHITHYSPTHIVHLHHIRTHSLTYITPILYPHQTNYVTHNTYTCTFAALTRKKRSAWQVWVALMVEQREAENSAGQAKLLVYAKDQRTLRENELQSLLDLEREKVKNIDDFSLCVWIVKSVHSQLILCNGLINFLPNYYFYST